MNLLIEVPFLSIGVAMVTFAFCIRCSKRVGAKS